MDAQNTTYIGSIYKVSAFPFFCYYWIEEQKLSYKINCKDESSFITIDATGSLCKKLNILKVNQAISFYINAWA